jgi:hypothetical protein
VTNIGEREETGVRIQGSGEAALALVLFVKIDFA